VQSRSNCKHGSLYKEKKYSVEREIIKPDYIIIDPDLILSTPKSIAAAAGMDAISQAIESLISMKSTD
jgi:alcohol dehydrogenase class IV